MYRHQRLHAIEKRLINFFSAAGAHTSQADFEELDRDLKDLRSGEYGMVAIDYNDLTTWVKGKIAGTSYADIIRSQPENVLWKQKLGKVKRTTVSS